MKTKLLKRDGDGDGVVDHVMKPVTAKTENSRARVTDKIEAKINPSENSSFLSTALACCCSRLACAHASRRESAARDRKEGAMRACALSKYTRVRPAKVQQHSSRDVVWAYSVTLTFARARAVCDVTQGYLEARKLA